MTRSQRTRRTRRTRRLRSTLAVGAVSLLVSVVSVPAAGVEEVVVTKPILKGSLADNGDVVRAPEQKRDVVDADGYLVEDALARIDVHQMDYKVGRLDQNDRQFWNRNAPLGGPNVIYGAATKIDGKREFLTLGLRFGANWKPGKKDVTPSFHVLFDGEDATAHTAGPDELIEGSSTVHSAGQYDFGGGVFSLSTGARSEHGFQDGSFDLDASLLALIDPKAKELRAVVPIPPGAQNFSVLTEEYVDGVPQRDVVTQRGGQQWWSLTEPSFSSDQRCLKLAIYPEANLDGTSTPVLHGALYDPTGSIPSTLPFGVGVIPDGATVPIELDGSWMVSPSGTHAWAEFVAAPGSLTYTLNGSLPEDADPATVIDPFLRDGWHGLADVRVGDTHGPLVGDRHCGDIPWTGECFGNQDWGAEFGIEGEVQLQPWRGADGSWSCVHLAGEPHVPFLNTGQLPRGVDAAWLAGRGERSYCHKEHVDIGAGGYLFQCPDGVASLVFWDHLSADDPLGLGFFVEYLSPEITEKPADYVAGDVPPGGLLPQHKGDALVDVGSLFMTQRKQDPELQAFITPSDPVNPE